MTAKLALYFTSGNQLKAYFEHFTLSAETPKENHSEMGVYVTEFKLTLLPTQQANKSGKTS